MWLARPTKQCFLPVILAWCIAMAISLPGMAQSPPTSGAASPALPKFRHIDAGLSLDERRDTTSYRILAVGDFPPYSFTDSTGSLAGINVLIAAQLCKEIRISCRFEVKPWQDLVAAKDIKKNDIIIGGLKIGESTLMDYEFSRPFILPAARFITRRESSFKDVSQRSLSGKRLGVVSGTAHEAYLERYYARATIRLFESFAKAGEALRTGLIDAVFGDAIVQSFWLTGTASRDCCRYIDGMFFDRRYFDTVATMAVKRGDKKLRDAIDYGLDRLQETGATDRILLQFFPVNPWQDAPRAGS